MACSIDELHAFFVDVSTRWAGTDDRILGNVVFAPPIGSESHGYNEDWTTIDASKVTNFTANASTSTHRTFPMIARQTCST